MTSDVLGVFLTYLPKNLMSSVNVPLGTFKQGVDEKPVAKIISFINYP